MEKATLKAIKRKIEIGRERIANMSQLSKNAAKSNEELLMRILSENKDTVYGRKYGFGNIKNVKEYMEKAPLTEYSDYEEYIESILNGGENILSARRPVHFAESSGSSGSPKKVPMCAEALEMFTDYTLNVCFGAMENTLGDNWKKSRGLSLANVRLKNLNGYSYGAVSSKIREKYKDVEHYVYTSPLAATYPGGETDTKYLHLRFALMEEDLSFITCAFLNTAVDAMKYFEDNWEMLAGDIERGTVNEDIIMPPRVRKEISEGIKPMPGRGRFIRKECEKGFDGILTRIWPDFKFIYGIGGGSFSVYADKMRCYMGGALLNESIYSASEGIFATHIAPEDDGMVMILDSAFYEFIDIERGGGPKTVGEIEKGRDYELVITNLSGFYRYKMLDVIKVVGFWGTCPVIKFLYRKNQIVSLAGEKTNDYAMQSAINAFSEKTGADVAEYSLYPDYSHSPARYIVFMEIPGGIKKERLSEYESALDLEIGRFNRSYLDKRKLGIIAPLKINMLREGSYAVYRQLMCAKGGASGQIKPVRLIDNKFRESFFFSMVQKME